MNLDPPTQPIHHPEIAAMRQVYGGQQISPENVPSDPYTLFQKWFAHARENKAITEPNAMSLATVNPATGRPSNRMVLLKDYDAEKGFRFYTNYTSRKAQDLDGQSPYAALCFWWGDYSVRIEGKVTRTTKEESDAYFASRPRGSQIGAWTSPQSSVLENGREGLEKRREDLERKFDAKEVSRPEFWGGYCVQPDRIEFWAGRPCRLHDRVAYTREDCDKPWSVKWLGP
ncbi:pyridoxamine 5'-phosphate oxidase [Phlyctochytrium arcticum]|nr:pyridoxamine 5'-phosphate oxidase [Phlyctochytrium arcticum]